MTMYYIVVRRQNEVSGIAEVKGPFDSDTTAISNVRVTLGDRTVSMCEIVKVVAIVRPEIKMVVTKEDGVTELT
jgi:hypothetical protein